MKIFDWITRFIPQEGGYRKTGAGIVMAMSDSQLDAMMKKGVNKESVFGLPGFKRGVDLISNKVSGCQAAVFKHKSGNGRDIAKDHSAYRLVRIQANPKSHPRDVFKQLISDACWNGNGYAWVQRDGSKPVGIWNLEPSFMTPIVFHNGMTQELLYSYNPDGKEPQILESSEVIHVKGLSTSCGLVGMRLIDYASEVLNLGLNVQKYASVFFETGGCADSWIEVPAEATLDEQLVVQMQEALKRRYSGVQRSRDTIILTGGAKLNKTYMSNSDSQQLESRGVTLVDVANLLGLPVSKLNGTGSYNYGSLESENVAILGETYDPWIFALENQLERCLLREDERDDYFIELDRNDLLRGDPTAQNQSDLALFHGGLEGWKEIRARRNKPTEIDQDDEFYIPAQLMKWSPGSKEEVQASGDTSVVQSNLPTDTPIQATALNGAQVASLLQITTQVTLGQLPIDSAKALITAAFPGLTDSEVSAIIGPLEGFIPEAAEEQAIDTQAESSSEDTKDTNGN